MRVGIPMAKILWRTFQLGLLALIVFFLWVCGSGLHARFCEPTWQLTQTRARVAELQREVDAGLWADYEPTPQELAGAPRLPSSPVPVGAIALRRCKEVALDLWHRPFWTAVREDGSLEVCSSGPDFNGETGDDVCSKRGPGPVWFADQRWTVLEAQACH